MITTAIFGILAIIFFGIAIFFTRPDTFSRFIFFGLAFLFVLLCLIAMAYEVQRMIEQFQISRAAPIIKQMEYISKMNADQLRALQAGQILGTQMGYLTPAGIRWDTKIHTPLLDLTVDQYDELVTYCLAWNKFPELPPQFGLSGWQGSDEGEFRRRLQAFHQLVANVGLVDKAGNNYVWRFKTRKEVSAHLQNQVDDTDEI